RPVLRTARVLPRQVPQDWEATGSRAQRLEAVRGHAMCAAEPSRKAETGAAGRGAPLLAPLRGRRPSAAFPSGMQKPEDNAPAYTRRSGTNPFRRTPQTVPRVALTSG